MVNHAKGKSRTLSEADTTISDTVEEKPCINCQEPFEPPYKALYSAINVPHGYTLVAQN